MKWRIAGKPSGAMNRTQVLVKWKGHDEMTWESSERLRKDMGPESFGSVPTAAELSSGSWWVADGESVGEVFDCRQDPPDYYSTNLDQEGAFEGMDGDEEHEGEEDEWKPGDDGC